MMEVSLEPLHHHGEGLHARLEHIEERARDPRRGLTYLIRSFIAVEQRQFATEGAYSGGWQELAPSTRERKAVSSLDPHILQATRRLQQSLTTVGHPDSDIRIVGTHELHLTTRVFYAVFHRRGTKKMPARNPIEITPEIRRRWLRNLQRFIVHGEVE